MSCVINSRAKSMITTSNADSTLLTTLALSQHGFSQSPSSLVPHRLTKSPSSTANRTISSHPLPQVGCAPPPLARCRSHLIPIFRLQAYCCKDPRRVRQVGCRRRKSGTLESQFGHRPRCIRWRYQSPKGNAAREHVSSGGTRI